MEVYQLSIRRKKNGTHKVYKFRIPRATMHVLGQIKVSIMSGSHDKYGLNNEEGYNKFMNQQLLAKSEKKKEVDERAEAWAKWAKNGGHMVQEV